MQNNLSVQGNKRVIAVLFAGFLALCLLATTQIALAMTTHSASKLLDRSASVHDPAGSGTIIDGTDCYGSGNDDDFSEYCITSFTFAKSDFGLGAETINSIEAMTYTLTHNDRFFSDGTEFEVYLTLDTFDVSFTGVSYDVSLDNGFDTSQYTNTPVSMGVFSYTAEAGGTMEMLALNFATVEADLITKINNGEEFNLIVVATAADADITFTGFDDNFEAGGQPVLAIDVDASDPSAVGLSSISAGNASAIGLLMVVMLAFGATALVVHRSK